MKNTLSINKPRIVSVQQPTNQKTEVQPVQKPAPRSPISASGNNLQVEMLRRFLNKEVKVRLIDGIFVSGKITRSDKFVIELNGEILIFKHAVSYIKLSTISGDEDYSL